MKPQFKPEEIYLDLSKLSEEQQRKVIEVLPKPINKYDYDITDLRFYLIYDEDCMWWVSTKYFLAEKTELTYSQFLDMMGESEEKSKVIENSEKERINNDGTLYIGEGLENYYKDQLERTGKFKVVSIDATSEEVLQVDIVNEKMEQKADRFLAERKISQVSIWDNEENENYDLSCLLAEFAGYVLSFPTDKEDELRKKTLDQAFKIEKIQRVDTLHDIKLLCAFQNWLGTNYTNLPTDSVEMTKRARKYLKKTAIN